MGPLESQGTELAIEMARRERDRDALMEQINPPAPPRDEITALSPETLHMLGGLLDAGGTYAGMKMGRGKEGNTMINAVAHQNPEATGAMALGGFLGSKLLAHLIRKKSPGLADALQANLGAEQMSLGSNWTRRIVGSKPGMGGFNTHKDIHKRWGIEQSQR